MRKLVTTDGIEFHWSEYQLSSLDPLGVRVEVEFAAPKHGTESHVFGGSVQQRKRWDPELRLFLPRAEDAPAPAPQERAVGNMVVGTVSQVGSQVTRYAAGDKVFGYGPICEAHQMPETHWRPLGNLSPQDAVSADPGHVAFVAMRDGNVRIGDQVAVFGLGAIGLMAVQIALAAGAEHVTAVDPIALRRDCAKRLGAQQVLDPRAGDAALAIKRATNNKGVDVAIETSGNSAALNEAIRCIRQCGTVVHVPWGPKDASQLHLDEEFHLNRPTIIGSQAWVGWGNPDRDYPLWDPERAYQAVLSLLSRGVISGQPIIDPLVDFEDAPMLFSTLFTNPAQAIKIGVSRQ